MESMHQTTARLFAAIKEKDPDEAITSRVASRMNVADNRVTNWKTRGISFEGAVQAEAAYGIPAAWVMYGNMPPLPTHWPFQKWVDYDAVARLSSEDLGYVAHSIKTALKELAEAEVKSRSAEAS
ncbi:hypothetical protein [Achromobacter denitrificans]|uniref:hypothetical protein n=1 Tax=Achromobacter denitrificans TaxID=32002 RepID=UPI003CFE165D